jgi:hypothetical protein
MTDHSDSVIRGLAARFLGALRASEGPETPRNDEEAGHEADRPLEVVGGVSDGEGEGECDV